jgi:hypothetical protein
MVAIAAGRGVGKPWRTPAPRFKEASDIELVAPAVFARCAYDSDGKSCFRTNNRENPREYLTDLPNRPGLANHVHCSRWSAASSCCGLWRGLGVQGKGRQPLCPCFLVVEERIMGRMMIKTFPSSGVLSATANQLRDVTASVVETAALVYIVEVVLNDVSQAVGIAQVNGQVSLERFDLKSKSIRQL